MLRQRCSVVRQVLLAPLLLTGHPGVVLLLVPHHGLLDGELLVADVAGERFVVDMSQDMLPQLVGADKLTRTEDAVHSATQFILLHCIRSIGGLLGLSHHLRGCLINILVFIVGLLVFILNMSNDMISGDEVLVTEMTLEVGADDASIVFIINVFVLRVLMISQIHVEVFRALMKLQVLLGAEG